MKKSNIKLTVFAVIFIFYYALVFVFSKQVKSGVENGIFICLNLLIPSLFMPTFMCAFFQSSGALKVIGRCTNTLGKIILQENGNAFAIFLLSTVSGYPVGSALIRAAYDNGEINKTTAEFLSLFSICAGPGFILIGVGDNMLFSREAGGILLISHIASAFVCAFVFSRFKKDSNFEKTNEMKTKTTLTNAFIKSVNSSAKSLTVICMLTVLFSSVTDVIKAVLPENIMKIFLCFSEATNGCLYFAKQNNLPMIAFVLGFSGMSVIAQVVSSLKELASLWKIIITRLISGVLSYIICSAILFFHPICLSVSLQNENKLCLFQQSALLSGLLIVSSIVFMISVHQLNHKRIVDFF